MKTHLLLSLALMLVPFPASAQSIFGHDHDRDHGSSFDASSGNLYRWEKHDHGYKRETHVDGMNFRTGSTWNTTIDDDGDMRGQDADGNHWTYDSGSRVYMNQGTGKICVGEGYARTCF